MTPKQTTPEATEALPDPIDEEIAQLLSRGLMQSEVARKVDLARSSVNMRVKKPEVQKRIAALKTDQLEVMRQILEGAGPDAMRIIVEIMRGKRTKVDIDAEGNEVEVPLDHKWAQLQFKAALEILRRLEIKDLPPPGKPRGRQSPAEDGPDPESMKEAVDRVF